jgi:hypothetical protein
VYVKAYASHQIQPETFQMSRHMDIGLTCSPMDAVTLMLAWTLPRADVVAFKPSQEELRLWSAMVCALSFMATRCASPSTQNAARLEGRASLIQQCRGFQPGDKLFR